MNPRRAEHSLAWARPFERFDPFTDIALDASGCWRWRSAKPDFHATVRRDFESRHEDANGTDASSPDPVTWTAASDRQSTV
jgi:hypothetical protein